MHMESRLLFDTDKPYKTLHEGGQIIVAEFLELMHVHVHVHVQGSSISSPWHSMYTTIVR